MSWNTLEKVRSADADDAGIVHNPLYARYMFGKEAINPCELSKYSIEDENPLIGLFYSFDVLYKFS